MFSGAKLRTACMYTEQCQHYDTHAVCSEVGFVHQENENIFLHLCLKMTHGHYRHPCCEEFVQPGTGQHLQSECQGLLSVTTIHTNIRLNILQTKYL